MNVVVNTATILAILSLCAFSSCRALLLQQDQNSVSEQRCDTREDCTPDKICHEHKCICTKEYPVEDQDRCLPQALIGESCSIASQCLVDSECINGICTCGDDSVSVYNPSSRIFYCQKKRGLEQECNSDLQCPLNAYCSGRAGCLCSNGYSPANVSQSNGQETTECLPKTCVTKSDCEEYHQCDETQKCVCIATHFDISRARCYKFGGTKIAGYPSSSGEQNSTDHQQPTSGNGDGGFISTLKDLTSMTSDKLWLVLIILITLSLLLLILILSLLRKHYLGYCWTAHKKEYEPNTAKQTAPKNGHFDKNSINNKSFRRRNGEHDDDDNNDDVDDGHDGSGTGNADSEDKSNLVQGKKKSSVDFVAVNLPSSGDHHQQQQRQQLTSSEQRRLNYHQSPLKSSTSTPV